jgi:hypothetical protein
MFFVLLQGRNEMKKNLIALAIIASFSFAGSASATDDRVTCMGCPETGNPRDNGLANIQFGGRGGWEGTTGAESMSSGVGNVKIIPRTTLLEHKSRHKH